MVYLSPLGADLSGRLTSAYNATQRDFTIGPNYTASLFNSYSGNKYEMNPSVLYEQIKNGEDTLAPTNSQKGTYVGADIDEGSMPYSFNSFFPSNYSENTSYGYTSGFGYCTPRRTQTNGQLSYFNPEQYGPGTAFGSTKRYCNSSRRHDWPNYYNYWDEYRSSSPSANQLYQDMKFAEKPIGGGYTIGTHTDNMDVAESIHKMKCQYWRNEDNIW